MCGVTLTVWILVRWPLSPAWDAEICERDWSALGCCSPNSPSGWLETGRGAVELPYATETDRDTHTSHTPGRHTATEPARGQGTKSAGRAGQQAARPKWTHPCNKETHRYHISLRKVRSFCLYWCGCVPYRGWREVAWRWNSSAGTGADSISGAQREHTRIQKLDQLDVLLQQHVLR